MSYSFDLKAGDRRIAAQIVEILNGGKPAEMPFFQETHWELVINLKAAKELGAKCWAPVARIACSDKGVAGDRFEPTHRSCKRCCRRGSKRSAASVRPSTAGGGGSGIAGRR
jgi:hypothetical protein